MNTIMRFGAAAILVSFLVLIANPAIAGSRTSFASTVFARNSVELDCAPYGSCADSQVDLASLGSADCAVGPGAPPHCSGGVATEAAADVWAITTQLFFWGPPYEAPAGCASTGMTVEATRESPLLLDVSLAIDSSVCDASVHLQPGPVEVAVFRYFGDPALFEEVDVASVTELVTLGLIQTEDILLREVEMYEAGDGFHLLSYSFDVTDVPSDELVVFASEHGVSFSSTVVTPALSPWGMALLIAGMLAVATWSLRRRFKRGTQ